MKRMGKVIGSSLFSLLLLLGLVLPMQNAVSVVQPLTVAANDITSHPAKGEVSGNGVYGYTTDYVCNGGPMQEEHAVQNGWHITAKNTYYAYGILWYQCWDTDDGDYIFTAGLRYNIHVQPEKHHDNCRYNPRNCGLQKVCLKTVPELTPYITAVMAQHFGTYIIKRCRCCSHSNNRNTKYEINKRQPANIKNFAERAHYHIVRIKKLIHLNFPP